MSEHVNKATIASNCRGEVLETLAVKFGEVARHSDA
jgi:hypothetical protein